MCECLKREGGWWMDECCAHVAEAWHNGKLPSPMEWEQAKARLEKLERFYGAFRAVFVWTGELPEFPVGPHCYTDANMDDEEHSMNVDMLREAELACEEG